jgi:phosphonate transport system substrate-binding protein
MIQTKQLSRRAALALLAGVALLAACGSDGEKTEPSSAANATMAAPRGSKLTIAVQPTNTPEKLSTDAKQLEEFLAVRLNRDVEIIFPTSYAGVIEALRFGHAQVAFMSAWPLALAQKNAGAEIALAEVREVVIGAEAKQEPYYFSYWVVRKDSPYTTLEDLRGKKVALPSALSTSGYVAPVGRMVELGLIPSEKDKEADPKRFFGEVLLAGGYAQGWEALKNGQVDATVIAGDVSEKLYREVLDNTRVVEQQGPVPSHGVAFARQLKTEERSQIKDALLALNNPEHRPLMRTFISAIFVGFKPTTAEEHLASLNKFLDLTQLQYVERLR